MSRTRGPIRRPLRAAALAAGTALALASCGVPIGPPSALSKSNAPGLFSPLPPSTVPTVGVTIQIYLLDQALVPTPVSRTVGVHANLTNVLSALVAGPTPNELLTTAIPASTTVLSASTQGNGSTVTVNFSGDFGQVSSPGQVEAVEQVVYTVATWLKKPDVGVLFEIDSLPVSVPTISPKGTFEPGPVTIQNYPLPPGSATTTTTAVGSSG